MELNLDKRISLKIIKIKKRSGLKQDMKILTTFVCLFQGCIPLQGCQVNELIANPDEPGRHLFEIVPGEVPSKTPSLVLPADFS